ncbi:MAG: LysR family transcriptional regulator [Agarilytica sp.]
MDKFKALEIYAAVVKQGSFAEAAKSLNANPSTVSKAIDRLEKSLGVRLFHRTTRQLMLTVAGEDYYQDSQNILNQLSACEENLRDESQQPVGELKVSAPVSYGRRRVVELLPKFSTLYPDIAVELVLDDDHVDLVKDKFDLAIRTGSVKDSGFVAQQLSCIDMVTCASPALIKKNCGRITKENIVDYPWVHYRFKHSGKLMTFRLKTRTGLEVLKPPVSHVVNDGEALLSLCVKGAGITQLPHFIAEEALRNKQLALIAPTFSSSDTGIYLVYPGRAHMPLRTRLFIEFIKAALQRSDETSRGTWAKKLPVLKSV